VLEAAGVTVDAEPPAVADAIEQRGIGFMLAPVFHPAMGAVIGPRRELGMRTVFNVLGPLTNPANADAQVVGVYDPGLVEPIARAFTRLDVERAVVVHGTGLDEIAVHGETRLAEVRGENIETDSLTPDDLGLERHDITAVAGGTPAENAEYLEGVVTGEISGAKRDIVLANAGAAVYVAGEVDSIAEGADLARDAIDSGAAREKLAQLRAVGG
jgi:anthranilate phosphoribosyltransferase